MLRCRTVDLSPKDEKYLYKISMFAYNVPKMSIRKILFFKPGAIGDFLHTLPALAQLRNQYPAASVTVVVSPGQDELIKGTTIADEIIVFDKQAIKKRFGLLIEFALLLRKARFDLFVDLQPSLRSLFLRRMARARQSLVYRKQKGSWQSDRRLHAVENFLATLTPLGVISDETEIRLPLRPAAQKAVEDFLSRNGAAEHPLIALNCSVGAARPARNWFPERFTELADRLMAELGASVLFVGGKEDRTLVKNVMAAMKHKALSAAGELSLSETAALLARCKCLVSSDTGPLHLATAVGTPVVGLFGSTDPARTGPAGRGHRVLTASLACVPCEEKDCPEGTRACMDAITVDSVVAAVRDVIL